MNITTHCHATDDLDFVPMKAELGDAPVQDPYYVVNIGGCTIFLSPNRVAQLRDVLTAAIESKTADVAEPVAETVGA